MLLLVAHLAMIPAELGIRMVATNRPPSDLTDAYIEHVLAIKLGGL
jgi:hypothetical protein